MPKPIFKKKTTQNDDGGAKASNLKNMKKIECEMIEQNYVQHRQHLYRYSN
jgi:hypothetical protein